MKRRRCISNLKNTSRNRVSSLDAIVGVQGGGNLSRAIKDNSAKTSEYACFQKFKKQAGHNCNSGSIPEKDIYNKKIEYVDCFRERSIVAQRTPKRAVVASFMKDVSSLNARSFLMPFKVGFPSNLTDKSNLVLSCPQMGEDLFYTKRARLYHHVTKLLGLEFNQLCSKRGDVIDVLLRRLFNQHEDTDLSILNNSQPCMFPATEFVDLPRIKENNCMDSCYLKCLEGDSLASHSLGPITLVPSRLDAIECGLPFALQAKGSSVCNESRRNNYYDNRWIVENDLTQDPYIHDGGWSLSTRPFNPFDCGLELDEADELEQSFDYMRDLSCTRQCTDQFISKIHTGGTSSSLSDSSPYYDSAVLFCLHWDAVFNSSIHSEEDSLCSNVNSSSEEFSNTNTCLTSVFETSDSLSFDMNEDVN